ncbi:uncharacterized protein C2845_PM06G09760 [Panicum miliaceum]|uniref:Ribonuclease H1 N-terminal domain-containing protein n=1 Tax=Panicum miliaceum TaxID=4540 RepID=A0A3L6RE18_PANMI|nr:uncharacterized protein C2845_PM06G09760 [Panicum miliaceum]
MVIWSCSSCLRGFISRSVWRRHYPLLSPRSPALPPTHFFFSSPRRSTKRSAAMAPMDSAREPFYVIRKGGVIGIYKTLNDCQAQVGNSQPDGSAESTLKRSEGMETGPSKHQEVAEPELLPDCDFSCILEFDGACKGNPGKSGAGVIIRRLDGSVVLDLWRCRSDNMAVLCKKAKELKGTFLTFQINHVLREFNSDADVQTNFAVGLAGATSSPVNC